MEVIFEMAKEQGLAFTAVTAIAIYFWKENKKLKEKVDQLQTDIVELLKDK